METLAEAIGTATIVQCLFTASAFIFFYKLMNKKLENMENRANARFDKMDAKIDEVDKRLGGKIEDIDRRLCRIEGSLSTHGHCLFSQSRSDQKAG